MPHCQNSSCSPCDALSQVEMRLAEAKALVERLTVETYLLKSAVNTVHDSLTHRLPRELVSRIFTFSVPPFAQLVPSPYWDPMYSSPGTLTLVCNAWKNIALSTPQLWNSFAIRLYSPTCASTLHLIETYIKRSGALPLAIRINMHKGEDLSHFPYAMFYPMFDILNVHSHRWHTLTLNIPFSLTSRLTGSPSSGASRLDCLAIHKPSSPPGPRSSVGFGSHHAQFRPSMIWMGGLYLDAIQIDWSHVTNVNVVSLSVEECLQLLRLAPLLREFRLGSILGGSGSAQVQVTHYSLQTWDLTSFGPLASLLCNQLTLPKLQCLKIYDGPYDSLERLLKRSSCPLSYFGLCMGDASGLISLFRAMPHLKHFCLEDLSSGDDEITSWCALMASTTTFAADSDESTLFLPRLETVEYYSCPRLLWATIPYWFPPKETKLDIRYRPLSAVHIDVDVPPSEMEDEAIDSNTIQKLINVVGRGFVLRINNVYEDEEEEAPEPEPEENFVEASMQYHNRRGVTAS